MFYKTDISLNNSVNQRLPHITLPPNVPPPLEFLHKYNGSTTESQYHYLPQPYQHTSDYNSNIRTAPSSRMNNLDNTMNYQKNSGNTASDRKDDQISVNSMTNANFYPTNSTVNDISKSNNMISTQYVPSGIQEVAPQAQIQAAIQSQQPASVMAAELPTQMGVVSNIVPGMKSEVAADGKVKKRKRGRPRKHPITQKEIELKKLRSSGIKRKRGRPRLPPLETRQKSKYTRHKKKNKTGGSTENGKK